MRKLPAKFESQIDNLMYIPVEKISPYLSKVSPNTITTIGVIFDIIAFYLCYTNKIIYGIIFFIIGYFFDCLDGYVARTYNKVTVFGDYYDHITDVLKVFGIFYMGYILNPNLFVNTLPFLFIISLMVIIHVDLQEKIYNKKSQGPSLSIISNIATYFHGNKLSNVKYSRFFGTGNILFAILLWLLYLERNKIYNLNGKKVKKN